MVNVLKKDQDSSLSSPLMTTPWQWRCVLRTADSSLGETQCSLLWGMAESAAVRRAQRWTPRWPDPSSSAACRVGETLPRCVAASVTTVSSDFCQVFFIIMYKQHWNIYSWQITLITMENHTQSSVKLLHIHLNWVENSPLVSQISTYIATLGKNQKCV